MVGRRSLSAVIVGMAAVLSLAASAAARKGKISGTVTDEDGKPIPGAMITITSPKLDTLHLSLASDAQGEFETSVQSASWSYTVKVEKKGFSPTVMDYKIPSGSSGHIDITLHPPFGLPPPPKIDPGVKAYNEGVALLQKGDKDGADKKFEEAVADKPDLTAAWKVLCQLAYEKKDYAAALADGKKVLAQDPSTTDLYGILMDSAEKTGDASAAEYKQKFYEANADNPDVNFNAGVEAYNGKDYAKAGRYFDKAISLKPDMANAYFWLAMSQFNLKNYAASRKNFQQYLKLDPQGGEAKAARDMLGSLPKK
jgi:Tfp pilus assembly protein PilF